MSVSSVTFTSYVLPAGSPTRVTGIVISGPNGPTTSLLTGLNETPTTTVTSAIVETNQPASSTISPTQSPTVPSNTASPTPGISGSNGTASPTPEISGSSSTASPTPGIGGSNGTASQTPGISGSNGIYTLFPSQIGNGVNVTGLTGFLKIQQVRSNWIAPGAVAGIAIATLLIGAAVAIAIMVVAGRKSKRKGKSSRLQNYAGSENGHNPAQPVPHTGAQVAATSAQYNEKTVMPGSTTDSDFLLPQPRDDQSMGSTANQLFVHIGNHVENFYHNNSMRETVSPQSEDEELLANRKTRFFALKRHICREVLKAIALDCDPQYSLLSPSVVSMAQGMSRGNMDENTYGVAWSRWKVSTALLLKTEDSSHKTQAREYWLDRLQRQLRPFQIDSPEMATSAQEDLHAICKLAENLGSLIFSQPATWEFGWPRSERRGRFVIVPDFVRTTDSKGRRLDRPKRVLEAQWMQ